MEFGNDYEEIKPQQEYDPDEWNLWRLSTEEREAKKPEAVLINLYYSF